MISRLPPRDDPLFYIVVVWDKVLIYFSLTLPPALRYAEPVGQRVIRRILIFLPIQQK
jgi:hypothetical protein